MLSIWIVESKSKGSRFMRVVSPRQVGLRPARSVFRHETAVRQSHPRLALPVDRRRRAPGRRRRRAAPSLEATGSPPREAAGAVMGCSHVTTAGGRRGRRGRQQGRRAHGCSRPCPTVVTGVEGGQLSRRGRRAPGDGRSAIARHTAGLVRALQELCSRKAMATIVASAIAPPTPMLCCTEHNKLFICPIRSRDHELKM